MDPYLEIASILPRLIDPETHRATISHPRLSSLGRWNSPDEAFLSWLESIGAPACVRELLSLGLPSDEELDARSWRIYSPATIRAVAHADPVYLRSRLLQIGDCNFYDDPIVVDLHGPTAGTVCFVDGALFRGNIPPFPRAYMRVVAADLTAFLLGIAKDAIATDASQCWSHSNSKGTWTFDPGPEDA